MSALDQAHTNLNNLVKSTLEINPGLESVERRAEYHRAIKDLHAGFNKQLEDFLKSGVWEEIDRRYHTVAQKAEPKHIFTDAEFSGIAQVVNDNMDPLADVQPSKQNDNTMSDMFADFLILVFNLGGQDFLNKHNIPATFELTNESISNDVKSQATSLFKGIDDTTSQWITDQITQGRQDGLSNDEIANNIRDQVPETYLNRAERIVRTETARMVGQSEHITATKNGASHKEWVTAGGACDICQANEDTGTIGIDQAFPSGDKMEPAHPNCRCLVEYVFTPFMSTIWAGQ